MSELFDIVDEADTIIGQATRKEAHAQGLLHREVHVWLITPDRGIIFQKRSLAKDTFPGLLGTSVGGHVAQSDYATAAGSELLEETGLTGQPLVWIKKRRATEIDAVKGTHNEAFVGVYALLYTGAVEDLKVESGEAEGFVEIPLTKLLTLTDEERAQFLPILTEPEHLALYQDMVDLVCSPLAPEQPQPKAAAATSGLFLRAES